MPVSRIVSSPHFSFITPEKFVRVAPNLATWGAAAGTAVVLLGSDVPLIKKDILSKIPVVGSYWAVPEVDQE
ncbi:ubiquinol-cytochrome-c reductase complex subunit-domain-containing protein [Gilbertella persicaria]|uniref:ubiquinol-cytochrome-c reductase complex subunit-domain-containing protein n=1 Tax=Gilbertella persicaria TaxID=101096 RepID=UPI00221E6796|nr:ubiquinol-cytochrome-c reductase complex subunit-domain-containing protein [Gilbertella persicaria]KAI8092244.1 ubiquinol-cytochrome-c reductase complex subunit-domain-containing protein [Gilbertella persicaria]